MAQHPKSRTDVEDVLNRCHFPDKEWRLTDNEGGHGWFVQVTYMEADVNTGEEAEQRGRKWYVSPYATESEIAQTLFAACLASAEHQVREHFLYSPPWTPCFDEGVWIEQLPGEAIFGPHFDSGVLWEAAQQPGDARDAKHAGDVA